MLFNSYGFVFAFLPLTLAVFFVVGRFSRMLAASWLAVSSVVFYAWGGAGLPALLLGSIAFNFAAGELLLRFPRKYLLALGIGCDLLVLGYFKYANFFNDTIGHPFTIIGIVLPIGISFFTFTQVAYLVDVFQGKVRATRPVHFLLFVSYFPHLIAGPILHHAEMMPQFERPRTYRFRAFNLAAGVSIFAVGLLKKRG